MSKRVETGRRKKCRMAVNLPIGSQGRQFWQLEHFCGHPRPFAAVILGEIPKQGSPKVVTHAIAQDFRIPAGAR